MQSPSTTDNTWVWGSHLHTISPHWENWRVLLHFPVLYCYVYSLWQVPVSCPICPGGCLCEWIRQGYDEYVLLSSSTAYGWVTVRGRDPRSDHTVCLSPCQKGSRPNLSWSRHFISKRLTSQRINKGWLEHISLSNRLSGCTPDCGPPLARSPHHPVCV